jgi:VWFA-related protein
MSYSKTRTAFDLTRTAFDLTRTLDLTAALLRRSKPFILTLLLTLACLPATLHAQSGRSRSDKGTASSGINGGKTSTDTATSVPSDEDGAIPQAEIGEDGVVRVNTTLVTVPVSVKDSSGRYVPNLSREDFRIFEEGVEQRMAYFATVDQPFTVALVIDTSRSTNFRLEDIQDAAIAFVAQLKEEDRVMVISFDDEIKVLTKSTNDRAELTRAIRRTRTGGGTRLYDAVDLVIKQHLKLIDGRKAIVLFTDGVDTTSYRATYESTLREAAQLDALIYPVSYDTGSIMNRGGGPQWPLPGGRGPVILGIPFPRPGGGGRGGGGGGTSRGDYARANAYLHELALTTGGRFYNGNTLLGISQAFEQVAEELRRQYSLGYYPKPPGQAGQRRQIKVRVNQPGLVVVARDSYIYPAKKTDGTQANEHQFSNSAPQANHLRETR